MFNSLKQKCLQFFNAVIDTSVADDGKDYFSSLAKKTRQIEQKYSVVLILSSYCKKISKFSVFF